MGPEGATPGASERVHVRRLDVADTLRWSWYALTDRPELAALTLAVQSLSVVTTLGISGESATDAPAIADWVWPVSVGYLLALAAAWGVYFLTAADAVAEGSRARSLSERARIAARRLPALAVAAVAVWLAVWVGVALFVVPGIYLFVRLVLVYPACVVDRKGPLSGLTAGWRASRGSGWKIFGVTAAYVVLTYGSGILTGLFGGTSSVLGSAVSAVFGSVLGPVYGLALGHLYLEASRNT
ncbi:hypothetical protein NGM10_02265 [Halorussus salilacus]|uniref:hypothetical protein n=1 Tax=Halorussus salilacus TaxID=2953750 RepID=UPI00209F066E|nr:hypothetical protein [Halorussus salilacus]USZ68576.1 hypothetical protein NGM10_02265 [Halorussus salilacus]